MFSYILPHSLSKFNKRKSTVIIISIGKGTNANIRTIFAEGIVEK